MDPITSAAYARMAGVDAPKINPRTGEEESKVRIRVEVRPMTQVLPGGHLAYRSTGVNDKGEEVFDAQGNPDPEARSNFFIAYESDVAAMKRLVEDVTDEQLAQVEREFDRRVKQWLADNGGDEADLTRCPVSRESAFRWVMGRDMRPIIALEELGEEPKGTKKGSKAA